MCKSGFFLVLALCWPLAHGHKESLTQEEIEVQRKLQTAGYNCAPAVSQYTASRKRAWISQSQLYKPKLPPYQTLLSAEEYLDDLLPPSDVDDTQVCCGPSSVAEIQNNTCVLAPEVIEGPYYHEAGHPLRRNLAELQSGLLLSLDIGVIDVNTCKPLPNVLVDIWQTNATGYYSGHPGPVEGGHHQEEGEIPIYPRTRPNETWLRGAWPTNENGVVQFTTIFPGYYQGRATHIHAKVVQEWTPLPNGTYNTGRVVHVGQFFFEDELNVEIDKMYPYSKNPLAHTLGRTRNWDDFINIFKDAWGPEGKYNPVFKMHLAGGIINQGLIGYITMGVNASFVEPLKRND